MHWLYTTWLTLVQWCFCSTLLVLTPWLAGIWPEAASFSDRVDLSNSSSAPAAYGPIPASFKGACEAGEEIDPATHCKCVAAASAGALPCA